MKIFRNYFVGLFKITYNVDTGINNFSLVTVKQFEAAMTPEEKERLYRAIDYQENSGPAEYPQAFIDTTATFILRKLEIELRDDEASISRVLFTELNGVKCKLDRRPAASAIK